MSIKPTSGFESVQGRRWNMEDCHILIDDLNAQFPDILKNDVSRSFYAVFDGHGGGNTAILVDEHLLPNILKDPNFNTDIDQALINGFRDTDRFVVDLSRSEDWVDGSTAAIAFLIGDTVIVANAGDSEVVIGKKKDKDKYTAVVMSEIHRPKEKVEKKRLQEAGAVMKDKRVGGKLAVSRGFGDGDLKIGSNGITTDWVSSVPFIKKETVQAEDFLLIACDGLWDEMSHQEAVDIVAKCRRTSKSTFEACDTLVKEALDKGSLDNITCILAYF